MRSQKGIGGFLRKRQEIRNQAEKYKEKMKKAKKKVKKIVKKSVLNEKVNKVKYEIGNVHRIYFECKLCNNGGLDKWGGSQHLSMTRGH